MGRRGGDGAILLVDDEAIVLATLTREIARTHRVLPCASADDAITTADAPGVELLGAIVDVRLAR